MMVDPSRIKKLNDNTYSGGNVVYWMSREQRVENNWALIHAVELANQHKVPLSVIFVMPNYEQIPTLRRYWFIIEGLKEVEKGLNNRGISFSLIVGTSISEVFNGLMKKESIGYVVTDFTPMTKLRIEQLRLSKFLPVPVCVVDAHNIVPCWVVSDKEEYSAFTFRKKITPLIEKYLTPFPKIPALKQKTVSFIPVDWSGVYKMLDIDLTVERVKGTKPGSINAEKRFKGFLKKQFDSYDKNRNNPNKHKTSLLSPYINLGQISAQYMAEKIIRKMPKDENRGAFLEQLIVRRELSDNYCCYNTNYDNFQGFRGWVKNSYEIHENDIREYVYTLQQFEEALTHDELWNAAQSQLLKTGLIHGYMRMYWAKKILEWSESPERAMEIAVFLNDKYALDGNDPNGYVGCGWAIGGVHDRPWKERTVFGKIRYMNYNGCKRKFDVEEYISSIGLLTK